MIDEQKTYTTLFLVPILGINEGYLRRFGFVNGYLTDVNHETEYENCIYLVFKPANLKEFELFVKAEKKRMGGFLLEDYDCGFNYVVLVYKIPDPFIADYKLFKEGKYSKFSAECIKLFPETVMRTDEDGFERVDHSLYFHVFNRSQALRGYWEEKLGTELSEDAEFMSIPNMKKEAFDIHKYIKEEENGRKSSSEKCREVTEGASKSS